MPPDIEKIYVVPAAGLVVRDPVTRKALPPEGAEVERSSYWIRRLLDGDATEGKAPAQKQAKEKA